MADHRVNVVYAERVTKTEAKETPRGFKSANAILGSDFLLSVSETHIMFGVRGQVLQYDKWPDTSPPWRDPFVWSLPGQFII